MRGVFGDNGADKNARMREEQFFTESGSGVRREVNAVVRASQHPTIGCGRFPKIGNSHVASPSTRYGGTVWLLWDREPGTGSMARPHW